MNKSILIIQVVSLIMYKSFSCEWKRFWLVVQDKFHTCREKKQTLNWLQHCAQEVFTGKKPLPRDKLYQWHIKKVMKIIYESHNI